MYTHYILTALMSLIALGWILSSLRSWRGMAQIPRLTQIPPAEGENLPRVSILYAARDEAERLPAALSSLLSLDYPDYEVIAVNDRSEDATPHILEEFARAHPRLKVVHVSELPSGWIGKPHGLQAAYEQSSGEWLIFTDADVRFAPDLLRRAMCLAQECDWDHLTLLAAVDLHGFWETATVTYLGLIFVFGNQPWRVSNPKATSYMGVGAFQMIRRSAYEAVGTHARLRMEVVDDMRLGKIIKMGGFRSGVALGCVVGGSGLTAAGWDAALTASMIRRRSNGDGSRSSTASASSDVVLRSSAAASRCSSQERKCSSMRCLSSPVRASSA